MTTEKILHMRSKSKCELCTSAAGLAVYEIPPESNGSAEQCILICETCNDQIKNPDNIDPNHWRCLNDNMWSQIPAVQVMAWRMLNRLSTESWPNDLLEILYLDDDTLEWAKAAGDRKNDQDTITHLDSNGATLEAGDTVTLIKDLNVKGTNFTAKRGTAVRGISLVTDNADQIEGKINGQRIVILTKFVKKNG